MDLAGIKIRVMESPAYIDLFKTLGANPIPMGWGEVYTALRQGTIDAQENPPWVIWAFEIYGVLPSSSIGALFLVGIAVGLLAGLSPMAVA